MHTFFKDNRRYLQLLVVTLLVISVFIFALTRMEIIGNAISRFIQVLSPFIYGFVIAYLLMPLVLRFENLLKKICRMLMKREPESMRALAIVCTFVVVIICIALLLYAIIPGLVTSIKVMVRTVPQSFRNFERWMENLVGNNENEMLADVFELIENAYNSLIGKVQSSLLPNLENIVSQVTAGFGGVLTVLKNFGLGCVVAIYMLASWEKFGAQGKVVLYGFVPPSVADWIMSEMTLANRLFGGFISGKIVDSAIIGVICFFAMVLLKMPYAMLVSVIVGVTNVIPFFGPYIGAIPSAILVLTESPFKCIIFIIFIIVLQQIDGNVIGPKILGDKIGISSFWILFSILFFGSYWGVIGMIVGVPIFGLVYDLVTRIMKHGLKIHEKTELYDEYHMAYEVEKEKPEKKRGKGRFGRSGKQSE